ncbi:hypothetical protein TRFO_08515 [Tritrichomonas foetus]|uniref:Uncharacterized protein n=1 Tax=Tritrichomonas foetus TaxID=1144522 RepID=A0A1J4JP13_9EUKA|nr:hypothetical protein TRFO_08515 [Tritrichomonas foetus]|eukprot:OHS99261.1 hypothetical protein TRFO_08515 [Tritrichomonas foetus]
MIMTKEWFHNKISEEKLETISIVLLSDPRSFYFSELLLQTPSFSGIILCTDAVYRLGRCFIKEIQILTANNYQILPVDLTITPLAFYQPYSFGEISIIPYPNGTGLGNCNWLITKGNDPELVSFSAFIVTGLCTNPIVYTPPTTPSFLDVICFLPSSASTSDCNEQLEKISREISEKLKDKKKIVIPSFIDDSLYTILYFLRYKKSFSNHFHIFSFVFQRLMEVLYSMPNHTELAEINEIFNMELKKETHMEYSSIYFAPYPTEKFGQIIDIRQFHNDSQTFFYPIFNGTDGLTMNSNWPKPLHFFDQIKEINNKLMIFAPPADYLNKENYNPDMEYTKDCALNNDLYKWMEFSDHGFFNQKVGNLITVGGEIEGERIIIQNTHQQTVLGTTTINDFGMKLIELGASDLKREGNSITCNFPFIPGDNEVTIDFDGEDITITTGSVLIENALFGMIHLDESTAH